MLKELKSSNNLSFLILYRTYMPSFATVNTKPLVNKAKTFNTRGFSSVIN